jgi:2,3-bisphosphoglycerate-independent phosphoglycerate mutase
LQQQIDALKKDRDVLKEKWLAQKKLVDAIVEMGGVAVITADHGNAEKMIACGKKFTEHTTNKVPFIIVNGGDLNLNEGKLANIAPTILDLLGVKPPVEFEEESLIRKQ